MLSRVAGKLFWTGRYLERSEDSAKLLISTSNLILDLPEKSEVEWAILLSIFDYDEMYDAFGKERSEYNIIKFLISDTLNLNSIQRNISMVRENIRTTRDALPYETWEYVNELYHFTNEHAHNSHNRKNRYLFLDQIISRCEQINGMLSMNLSRDHAHRFLSLGRLIERADMATRIIDITTRFEKNIKNQGSNSLLEQHLWTCLLKAISCFSSYRQYVGPEIENHQAINFIFKERTNPRSILFCLKSIRSELQELKNNSNALKIIDNCMDSLLGFKAEEADALRLEEFIDDFQIKLNDLNGTIYQSWFKL